MCGNLEIVQNAEQLRGRHLLVLLHLVVEVVAKALGSGKGIALLHDVQKTVGQHPALQAQQGVQRALARGLVAVGANVGGQATERGFFLRTGLVGVLKHQVAPLGEQFGLQRDQFVHALAGPLRCR